MTTMAKWDELEEVRDLGGVLKIFTKALGTEKMDVVVDRVDASNLERNLYLAVQLLEMGATTVIALNMIDVAESRGYQIDIEALSREVGVPVVPMVATRNEGSRELLRTIINIVEGTIKVPGVRLWYGQEVEEEIAKIERLISESSTHRNYSPRWLAIKLLEEDAEIIRKFEEPNIA